MNAKTARKLRKIATGMVLAAEEKSGNKIQKSGYKIHPKTGVITVAENTWKGAYKALKKGLRKTQKGAAFHQSLTSTQARHKAVVNHDIEAPVL